MMSVKSQKIDLRLLEAPRSVSYGPLLAQLSARNRGETAHGRIA